MRISSPDFFNHARTIEESIFMLQEFLVDESTEAFIEEEEAFGKRENWIKCNDHYIDTVSKSSIKIEVFSEEEGIPHFRAKIAEYTANYSIKDCTKTIGEMPSRYHKKILVWYRSGKSRDLLIQEWNNKRPEGCQVGEYREEAEAR